MKYLKLALDWIKSNVVTVICVVVAIGSILMILQTKSKADKWRESLAQRAGKIQQINALARVTKPIPSPQPDAPPDSITLTITQPAIDRITEVFTRMQSEYLGVYEYAVQINQAFHVPMLESLFPSPPPAEKFPRRFDARNAYRDSFRRMFESYSPSVTTYPQLNARMPRSHVDDLAAFERTYLATNFVPARSNLGELNPEELNKYYEQRKQRMVELIRHDAEAIHLYADPVVGGPEFPFTVGGWSNPTQSAPPTMTEIWEGQMDLWLQQDVARAIMQANRVSSPESNVMVAPVKKLIKVEPTTAAQAAVAGASDSGFGGPASGAGDFGNFGQPAAPPPGATAGPVDEGLAKSPTGRKSNDLYDVRYVKVILIADFHQLPTLFDAIAHTNFMTVTSLSIKDVDEYEYLQRGYHFGTADAVEITMTIESLWMRSWLLKLMPDEVLETRGLTRTQPGSPALP